MDAIAKKVIDTLDNWNGKCREQWTERYHNCVGYWTYTFGSLAIQDSLCIHVLYNGEEIASYHKDNPSFDLISRSLWNARQRQKDNARDSFLKGDTV